MVRIQKLNLGMTVMMVMKYLNQKKKQQQEKI